MKQSLHSRVQEVFEKLSSLWVIGIMSALEDTSGDEEVAAVEESEVAAVWVWSLGKTRIVEAVAVAAVGQLIDRTHWWWGRKVR